MTEIIFRNLVTQQDNRPDHLQTLNNLEATTLRSLIMYTADAHKQSPAAIEAATLQKFKAASIHGIAGRDFDKAVRYLVDLQPHPIVH